jgi:hypothetical protein
VLCLRALASSFDTLQNYEHVETRALVIGHTLKHLIEQLNTALQAWHRHEDVIENICKVFANGVSGAGEAIIELLSPLVTILCNAFIHTHFACTLSTIGVFISM